MPEATSKQTAHTQPAEAYGSGANDRRPNSTPASADPFASMADQLQRFGTQPQPPHFNPRPPGVMQGGATETVLVYLRAHPGRYFRFGHLIAETGCSRAALGWALIRLQRWGLVETIPDPLRNGRYLRYRAVLAVGKEAPRRKDSK